MTENHAEQTNSLELCREAVQEEPPTDTPHPPLVERVVLRSGAGLLLLLVVCAALAYVGAYCYMAWFRVPYVFELEWLESGMAHQVQRVLDGKALYCAPSIEYIPFVYTPLYFYVCALVCSGSGVTFAAMRSVSFLASLSCFLMIFLHVRRETRSFFSGIVALGLYAATFRIAGAWFDTARVDSLFLFFLLAGVYLARFCPSRAGYASAGLLLALAYLTKQSALVVILPVCCGAVILDWRRSILLILTCAVVAGGSTLLFNHLSEGWYVSYLFGQPAAEAFVQKMWLGFWTKDLLAKMSIASSLALFGLFIQLGRKDVKHFLFYGGVAAGMVAVSWASRLHPGGYNNVLMPVYAWIAILTGLAIGAVFGHLRKEKARLLWAAQMGLCSMLLVQFASLLYDPRSQIPSDADYQAGQRLLELIGKTEGDVFIPYHNFLPALAAKPVFASKAGINGILDDRDTPRKARLLRELKEALREKRFGLVVLNTSRFLSSDLKRYYDHMPFPMPTGAFYPVTGMRTRPAHFYRPKRNAPAAQNRNKPRF